MRETVAMRKLAQEQIEAETREVTLDDGKYVALEVFMSLSERRRHRELRRQIEMVEKAAEGRKKEFRKKVEELRWGVGNARRAALMLTLQEGQKLGATVAEFSAKMAAVKRVYQALVAKYQTLSAVGEGE
jgi:hypothetical protein